MSSRVVGGRLRRTMFAIAGLAGLSALALAVLAVLNVPVPQKVAPWLAAGMAPREVVQVDLSAPVPLPGGRTALLLLPPDDTAADAAVGALLFDEPVMDAALGQLLGGIRATGPRGPVVQRPMGRLVPAPSELAAAAGPHVIARAILPGGFPVWTRLAGTAFGIAGLMMLVGLIARPGRTTAVEEEIPVERIAPYVPQMAAGTDGAGLVRAMLEPKSGAAGLAAAPAAAHPRTAAASEVMAEAACLAKSGATTPRTGPFEPQPCRKVDGAFLSSARLAPAEPEPKLSRRASAKLDKDPFVQRLARMT
ncbi:hypothetical protein RM543_00405 [Roseicyclus sp. F158]|uniref:Histidine kinase n=1 Tax=Tropicimonas omnivorans TaxID=3075590 RepID=A0ABU3DBP3_9RHOB|nr:hypothetical protein [Roseicyclus sp. F158]MDT0681128.1 hypothetical protein [Roseicyclus sp. F158]